LVAEFTHPRPFSPRRSRTAQSFQLDGERFSAQTAHQPEVKMNHPEENLGRNATRLAMLVVLLCVPVLQYAQCQGGEDQPVQMTPPRDAFAEVGQRVSSFGGMFVDEAADTLYVYLVAGGAGDATAVDKAISDIFRADRPPLHHFQVLAGKYTYLQLREWQQLVTQHVLTTPGVAGVGVNQTHNRLSVDVESANDVWRIRGDVAALGMPADAFSVGPTADWNPNPVDTNSSVSTDEPADTCTVKTLQDRCRPLVGGLRIAVSEENDSKYSLCTLGFMATWKKVRGFVTNDHCLRNDERPQDSIFYQPGIAEGNRIGVGCYNPKVFSNETNKDCPAKSKKDTFDPVCRYADATFAKLDSGIEASMGLIAQASRDSNKWDGAGKYKIIGQVNEPMEGQFVRMVGQVSGTISGKIDSLHKNLKKHNSNEYELDQITLDRLDRTPVNGDSGSPVFVVGKTDESGIINVTLVGIFWGTPDGSTSRGDISPITNVKMTNELGPTLQVCADGSDPKC
jgi:hypothetical protein